MHLEIMKILSRKRMRQESESEREKRERDKRERGEEGREEGIGPLNQGLRHHLVDVDLGSVRPHHSTEVIKLLFPKLHDPCICVPSSDQLRRRDAALFVDGGTQRL